MKNQYAKTTLILVLIFGLGSMLLNPWRSGSSSRAQKVTPDAQAAVPTQVSPQNEVSSSKPKMDMEKLASVAPSLSHFADKYAGLSESALKAEMQKSKNFVEQENLYEKSNRGDLTEQETIVLVRESRRQAILASQITKLKIESFKRRHL